MGSFQSYLKTITLGFGALILALGLILFPEPSFTAALKGLKLWWDVVFPALLPFFITSEILLGLGLAHFMGVLLESLMRPIFNVSGYGSFVWTMGFASGYPISAKLTCRLREQKLVTRAEGERLVSFTTSADPVFITGAIAVGFFHSAKIGMILLFVHYFSAILVGFCMRLYGRNEPTSPPLPQNKDSLLIRALNAMHKARIQDGRSMGKLMGDAVATSLQTQLAIGGFILFFSVILSLFTQFQIIPFVSEILKKILRFFELPLDASQAFVYGLFEVTLGAKEGSEIFTSDTTIFALATTGAILAWGGISVHAQVASILAETDLRYFPFFIARLLHSVIAFILTYLIAPTFLTHFSGNAVTVWLSRQEPPGLSWWSNEIYHLITLTLCGGILLFSFWLLNFSKRKRTR